MKKFWLTKVFVPGEVKEIIVGLPANAQAVKLGNNQSITQEEADAIEAIEKAGYKELNSNFFLMFQLVIGPDFKGKFGY